MTNSDEQFGKELHDLYVEMGKTAKEIAQMYEVSENEIKVLLAAYKIRKSASQKCKSGHGELLTKENLQRMYNEEGLNLTQIAERIGVSRPAIAGHFQRKGIPYTKETGLARRRMHPNSIKALREHKPKWEDYSQKRKDAFRFSKGPGMSGKKHSEETRSKMSKSRIRACSTSANLTKAELRFAHFLKSIKISHETQYPLFTDEAFLPNACLDYYISAEDAGTKHPVALLLDSRYHHNRPKNIIHDTQSDFVIVRAGYILLRIWDDEAEIPSKFHLLMEKARGAEGPCKLAFKYPDHLREKRPIQYVRDNTEVERLGLEDLKKRVIPLLKESDRLSD